MPVVKPGFSARVLLLAMATVAWLAACRPSPPSDAERVPPTQPPDARHGEAPEPVRADPQGDAVSEAGDRRPEAEARSGLADLLLRDVDREALADYVPAAPLSEPSPPTAVNDDEAFGRGIRKLEGRYLTLYTDLPGSVEVDEIPRVFDQAVPQWAAYFATPLAKLKSWQLTGFLIGDQSRFRQSTLLPEDLPEFLHGYQRGYRFWVYDQPSAYYRRHLVLHEGVHAFMQTVLGGTGAPWYREGIAELLATHRWRGGKLLVRYMPKSRDEVPYWGRIKAIQDEFAAARGKMIREVMQYDSAAYLRTEPYAWSWAVAAFLDGHPAYRYRFRNLRNDVRDMSPHFTRRFQQQLIGQLRQFDEQWQLFVINIDYGYDFERTAVLYRPGMPLGTGSRTVSLAADRGWQSTGIRLEAGGGVHHFGRGAVHRAATAGGVAVGGRGCDAGVPRRFSVGDAAGECAAGPTPTGRRKSGATDRARAPPSTPADGQWHVVPARQRRGGGAGRQRRHA